MIQKLNKLYAKMFGYFWTDCPVCQNEFGGHQWKTNKKHSSLATGPSSSIAVCPKCVGSQFVIEQNRKISNFIEI